ncbi:MAG: aminopeptidase P family protein [Muribaculaceae bacterium]|nr:aminopeptidase P family protein [Muribaculaceae bacterium]
MKLIPDDFKNEIYSRIDKIKNILKETSIDAVLIGSNANIYYTSGRFFRGYVYITISEKPLWFVVKPQVYDQEEDVYSIRKPEDISEILRQTNYENPSKIALEENDLSYSDIIRLKALFPFSSLENGSPIVKKARMVKTEWELNEMRIDGKHQAKVYGEVKDCYKEGMTDLQLQIEIEKRLRLEGSLGVSRVAGNLMEINLGSVISGDNADNPGPYEFTMGGSGVHPALPVGANDKRILEGHTVMIDMNGAFNGYQSDMTRVWSLGETSEFAKKAHKCSIRILRTLEQAALPGVAVKDLYETAMKIVTEESLQEFFMGHKSQVGFIGHGVGIELNELPVLTKKSKDILEENMTIAIEPKFVIPHIGAVGVENTYIVTKEGLENITIFPEEIQKF